MALYHYLPALHTDAETVVAALALYDADGGILGGYGLVSSHQLHVVGEHLQGLLHDGSHLALHLVGHRMLAVVPHHVAGQHRCGHDDEECGRQVALFGYGKCLSYRICFHKR